MFSFCRLFFLDFLLLFLCFVFIFCFLGYSFIQLFFSICLFVLVCHSKRFKQIYNLIRTPSAGLLATTHMLGYHVCANDMMCRPHVSMDCVGECKRSLVLGGNYFKFKPMKAVMFHYVTLTFTCIHFHTPIRSFRYSLARIPCT